MTSTAPETIARYTLISALEAEFADEEFPVRDDHLHPEQGQQGTVIGVSPDDFIPDPRNALIGRFVLKVQFYGKWEKSTDPTRKVSPAKIEGYAQRFREMVRTSLGEGTGQVWYFMLDRLSYPTDPTGNKTRFEAFLTARGNNPALLETA